MNIRLSQASVRAEKNATQIGGDCIHGSTGSPRTAMVSPHTATSVSADITSRWANKFALVRQLLACTLFGTTTLAGQSLHAADLTIADDVIVKFGRDAGLTVRDRLVTGQNVHLTSLQNDAAGGQTGTAAQTAQPGQWRGLKIDPAVTSSNLVIRGLRFSYAGGNGGAAIEIPQLNAGTIGLQSLIVGQSTVGLRISGGAGTFAGISVLNNATGVEVSGNATPTFSNSEFVGNTAYGINNLAPASVVQATGNWWGATSGPRDTDGTPGNPSGSGSRVSTGVNYGSYTAGQPLIDCSIRPANGSYTTPTRNVSLALACRNAVEVRVAESTGDLAAGTFATLSSPSPYVLSAALGNKTLYAEFRSAGGAASPTIVVSTPQPFNFAPGVPQVVFTAPANNATITTDTALSATATDVNPITSMQFFVNGTSLGIAQTTPPFSANWPVANFTNGTYTLEARAINSLGATGSATITVTLAKSQTDFTGPTLGALSFAGAPFVANQTVTAPGTLAFGVTDPSGVASVVVKIGSTTLTGGGLSGVNYTQLVDFLTVADGAQTLVITATDSLGNTTTKTVNFTLALAVPTVAPTITSPANNSTVNQTTVGVSGRAPVGTQVQLYVNGAANGGLVSVSSTGDYYGQVGFSVEGINAVTADARNPRGTTPLSAVTTVNYLMTGPSVTIISPAAGVTLSDPVLIDANVSSQTGVASVVFKVNGNLIGTTTLPPYRTTLNVASLNNGAATITATATDTAGRSISDTRTVTIAKLLPPVVTPYLGEVAALTPQVSYGQSAITVQGSAKDRLTSVSVPNAALRLILSSGGTERKVTVITDVSGNYSFNFVPQNTDAGTYSVVAVHPDEFPIPVPTNNFTINRLNIAPARYSLNAPKGFSGTIRLNVTASAGLGARDVVIRAPASAQPGGALPSGVSVAATSPIDIGAGQTVPIDVTVTTTSSAIDTGIIILQLTATESGSAVRGDVRVDYRLYPALPALTPTPSILEMGLRQNQVGSGIIILENKGLVAAQNVVVSLLREDGTPAPVWVNLVSAPQIGNVAPGDKPTIQINAAPTTTIADGVYQLRLRVSSTNGAGGDIPISVAVTQAGDGTAQFHVVDIFTNTIDKDGARVTGVKGATISIENENVASFKRTLETPLGGIVSFTNVPAGTYRYRITGPNHKDAGGRIRVNPGSTTAQRVLIDYSTVSVSFAVTETTITDVYDITLSATYRTFVPAPVILIEPLYINIPPMQVGEEITGEISISNYGLIRANKVNWKPPVGDSRVKIEFFGEVPSELAAKQRIVLPYKITQLAPLPASVANFTLQNASSQLKRLGVRNDLKSSGCYTSSYSGGVACEFPCAGGDISSDCGAGLVIGQTIGASCGGPGGPGGGGGGPGGGWGGAGGGGTPSGTSLGGLPCKGCTTCGPCN
jgi:large repetitive protein